MKKVYYFLSNRCSYARSKILLHKLDREFNLSIIMAGALTSDGFEEIRDEIKNNFNTYPIDIKVDTNTLDGMAYYSVMLADKVCDILIRHRPDAIVLWADRFELLPVAMIANYLQIPIVHLQGGEETGNVDNYVRNAVSSLSQLHFVSHSDAATKLTSRGLTNVYNTGCPSIDIIKDCKYNAPSHNYVICIFHPHTDELDQISFQTNKVFQEVTRFCDKHKLSLYWFAPNNDPGHHNVESCTQNISVIKNLVGDKFINLLAGAKMIVGNSSAGIRESSFLAIPSVVIGDRQKERLTGMNVVRSSFDTILESMEKALIMKPKPSKLFGDGKSSDRIVKLIKEYLNEQKI